MHAWELKICNGGVGIGLTNMVAAVLRASFASRGKALRARVLHGAARVPRHLQLCTQHLSLPAAQSDILTACCAAMSEHVGHGRERHLG